MNVAQAGRTLRSPLLALPVILITTFLWLAILWRIAALDIVGSTAAVVGVVPGWILTVGVLGYLAEIPIDTGE